MYRALALKAIENDLDFDEEAPLLALTPRTTILLEPTREGNRVLLDRADVTRRVRDVDVTAGASRISVHPGIRAWMVAQQRLLGAAGGVVMEGRDIGTAVFPDAEVKIFLDADPSVRGSRRFRQIPAGTSSPPTSDAVLQELKERDARDRARADSPLKPAIDAVLIDSTCLSLDEVLQQAEAIVQAHLSSTPAPVS